MLKSLEGDLNIAKPSQCLPTRTTYFMPASLTIRTHAAASNFFGLNLAARRLRPSGPSLMRAAAPGMDCKDQWTNIPYLALRHQAVLSFVAVFRVAFLFGIRFRSLH